MIAVEDGKKVGYQIGEQTKYFADLPAGWEGADAMVLQALRVGYQMGTQSPSAQGLVSYINTTQTEKMDALAETVEKAADDLKTTVQDAFVRY